jgi:hypothetical protein
MRDAAPHPDAGPLVWLIGKPRSERLGLRQACEDGSFKQVGLRSEHVRSH